MGNTVKDDFFYLHTRSKEESFDYFESKEYSSINSYNCPQEFFSIISLFAEDCNFNLKELRTYYGILVIKGSYEDDENDLMLRYGVHGDLTVARVKFIHQRQGKMTKLLRYLEVIKNKNSLNEIIIESVLTDEMRAWCLKNDFIESPFSKDQYKR